jgi:hypothetical protein
VGQDEERSGKGVVDAAWLVGLHPLAHLVGPPADEHGAGSGRDLLEVVRCHEVGERATSAQSIVWPGPAMKPSSDIDLFTTTFPVLVSLTLFLQKLGCSRDPFRASSAAIHVIP